MATPPGWSPQNAHRTRAPRDVSRGWNLGGRGGALCATGGGKIITTPTESPPSPRRGIKFPSAEGWWLRRRGGLPRMPTAPGPRATCRVGGTWAGGGALCATGGGKIITTPTERNSPPSPRRGIKSRDGNKIPRRGAGINTAGFFIQPKYLHNSWRSAPQTVFAHFPSAK